MNENQEGFFRCGWRNFRGMSGRKFHRNVAFKSIPIPSMYIVYLPYISLICKVIVGKFTIVRWMRHGICNSGIASNASCLSIAQIQQSVQKKTLKKWMWTSDQEHGAKLLVNDFCQ